VTKLAPKKPESPVTVTRPRSVITDVSAMLLRSPVANSAASTSPRRHPGDRGRFAALPTPYRDRTATAKIWCLAVDLIPQDKVFRLVARAMNRDS
jgi:hypothetical protein